MTDKQIMIDGVNVNSLSLGQIARMSRYEVAHLFVKLVKTLNRTEDDYNKAQEDRVKMWTDNTNLTEQLKRKEQECKNVSSELIEANKQVIYLAKQLNQLKEDNEELKKQLQAQCAFTRHEQKLIYCVAYDETCKTGNDCKQEKCIFKDNIKLKQTLTEIKEIAEICSFTDNSELLLKRIKLILQKISEVQNENK